jgi:methylmalonyl-CoA mutase N-terminal domain/subunit
MKEHFQVQSDRSCQLRFHTQTAGSKLTAQQPHVNIARVTLQALAAVLGGTQSLHTNSWDEALALPTEASVLLALRTQQVLAYESGVADTVDPLAGSYYIERMTDDIEKGVWDYLDRIDQLGGMLKAIESGYIQKEIQDSAYRYARALEDKEEWVVGVNLYRTHEEPISEILRIDPQTEKDQVQRLKDLRKRRDSKKVEEALRALRETVTKGGNIMAPLADALSVYATLGEICDLLRHHFGEYKEMTAV